MRMHIHMKVIFRNQGCARHRPVITWFNRCTSLSVTFKVIPSSQITAFTTHSSRRSKYLGATIDHELSSMITLTPFAREPIQCWASYKGISVFVLTFLKLIFFLFISNISWNRLHQPGYYILILNVKFTCWNQYKGMLPIKQCLIAALLALYQPCYII